MAEAGVTHSSDPSRVVHHAEARAWLASNPLPSDAAIVTSLPDVSELAPLSLDEWRTWFVDAAGEVLRAVADDAVSLFYQTDVIEDGTWVDKGYLVQRAAEAVGARMLWHRIVCRLPAGTVHYGRPAYSHLLAFSRGLTLPPHRQRRDVLPSTGEMPWARAMGVAACVEAIGFARDVAGARVIVDPFCGHGTALAVANAMGLDAVGVELSRKRVRKAKALQVDLQASRSLERAFPRVDPSASRQLKRAVPPVDL